MPTNNTRHTFPARRLGYAFGLWLALVQPLPVSADGTAPCNTGAGLSSTECGVGSNASGSFAIASGFQSAASGSSSTATGVGSIATGTNSTATGGGSTATADFSTATGGVSLAQSIGATSLGFGAGSNAGGPPVTDSPAAIAVGYRANFGAAAPGAIAIGGDTNNVDALLKGAEALGAHSIALGDEARTDTLAVGGIAIGGDADGDGLGAQALADNAIAIGADVTAVNPDTMTVGVAVRVVPKSVGVSEKVLMRLENRGGVNFKLNDTSVADGEWTFRTGSQGGKFVIGKTGSGVQEMQVFSGGNMFLAGNLTQGSSRTKKENIKSIASQNILDKVLDLPISEWNYIHDKDNVRHIGPMAEDFHESFKVGSNPKGISSLDSGGVALAAIQGLKMMLDVKDIRIAKLESEQIKKDIRITELESGRIKKDREIAALKQRLALLETDRDRIVALEQLVKSLIIAGELYAIQ